VWRSGRAKLTGAGLIIALVLVPSVVFADTNVRTRICSPFNAPSITAPATGSSTTSSSLHVVGYADPGLVVSIQNNDTGAGATTATTDGSYAINVPLDTGSNSLVASHTNDCNTVKKSATVQALRVAATTTPEATTPMSNPSGTQPSSTIQTTKPIEVTKLTAVPASTTTSTAASPATMAAQAEEQAKKDIITEPKAGEVLSSERTWITGKTTPATKVDIYVNHAAVASVISADDGIYGALVSIKSGRNNIQVQATAADGTVITVRSIDVELVKKTVEDTQDADKKDELKGMKDVAGWVAIGAIGVGGLCIMSFILWHTHQLKLRRKR